jgi:8-oxo-dGTP pyrophosphatase MutT (NUDIX family)
MDGKWRKRGSNRVYETEWVTIDVADVELPNKTTVEHHVVRVTSGEGAGMLAFDPAKGVLLIWRHRFITEQWGWELPSGGVDGNETPKQAAMREFTEETGWKANTCAPLVVTHRMPGIADDTAHAFITRDAEFVGPGRDTNEAADISWLSVEQIKTALQKNEVTDALTVTSLLYAMQFGLLV